MLLPLRTVTPEGVCAVSSDQWEVLEDAVDSGATENVIDSDSLKSIEMTPGAAFRRGVSYEVANGVTIPNLGENEFKGFTEEGHLRGLKCQVCDVSRPLLSVAKIVKAGNTVVFGKDGAYVQDDRTGEQMRLKEENGMYILRLWVKNEGF